MDFSNQQEDLASTGMGPLEPATRYLQLATLTAL